MGFSVFWLAVVLLQPFQLDTLCPFPGWSVRSWLYCDIMNVRSRASGAGGAAQTCRPRRRTRAAPVPRYGNRPGPAPGLIFPRRRRKSALAQPACHSGASQMHLLKSGLMDYYEEETSVPPGIEAVCCAHAASNKTPRREP